MKYFTVRCETIGDMIHGDIYYGKYPKDMKTVIGTVQVSRGQAWTRFQQAFSGANFVDKNEDKATDKS